MQPEPERAEAGPLVYELSALRRPVGEILASAEAGPLIHELSALRRPVGEILAGAAAASAEERAAPAERSPSTPSAQPDRAAGRARSPSPNAARARSREGLNARSHAAAARLHRIRRCSETAEEEGAAIWIAIG